MKDAAAIAKGLTEAQREALLMTTVWSGNVSMSPTLASLLDLGLLQEGEWAGRPKIIARGGRVSNLGLEVRAILQATPPHQEPHDG